MLNNILATVSKEGHHHLSSLVMRLQLSFSTITEEKEKTIKMLTT